MLVLTLALVCGWLTLTAICCWKQRQHSNATSAAVEEATTDIMLRRQQASEAAQVISGKHTPAYTLPLASSCSVGFPERGTGNPYSDWSAVDSAPVGASTGIAVLLDGAPSAGEPEAFQ